MVTTLDKILNNTLRGEVVKIIENIAVEENIKDFEIIVKEASFTGDNYLGEISRIKILSKCCEKIELNLILKKAPTSESIRKLGTLQGYYKTEIYMYTTIAPAFKRIQEISIPIEERIHFAKFYSGFDDDMNELIILKDLTKDGYVIHEKNHPQNLDHAKVVLKYLSTLHAFSFALKQNDPELFSRLSESVPTTMNYGDIFIDMVKSMINKTIGVIDDPINRSKLMNISDSLPVTFTKLLDASLTEPFNVISHGDCWNNNMLFKYKDGKPSDIICIDWQILRVSTPVTDILYYMCMSMDSKIFRNNLEEILQFYYNNLRTAAFRMSCDIDKCFPEEVFRQHFRNQANFGLSMAMVGLPIILADSENSVPLGDVVDDIGEGDLKSPICDKAKDKLNDLLDIYVNNEYI